ncbi:MAG: hypothetical protein KIT14_22620 [bacterium]|nr:hypothetical protein [bacterium]
MRGRLALWLALHVGHGAFTVTPSGATCFGCGARATEADRDRSGGTVATSDSAGGATLGLDVPDAAADITADVIAAQVVCRVHGAFPWWQAYRSQRGSRPREQCHLCVRSSRNARYARATGRDASAA